MTTTFASWKTDADIILAIYTGVMSWIEGKELPSVASLNLPDSRLGELSAMAYSDQTRLGWLAFLHGFWVSSWHLAQEEAFWVMFPWRNNGWLDNGPSWSSRTICWFLAFFELIWHQWCDTQHGVRLEEIL